MIRQAISCDICGSEKRQTNHWFVAYELSGELRMSGWSSRHRLRPGSKHLCGQTCLHKLVDEFMAKSLAKRAQPGEDEEPAQPMATDTSLTSKATFDDESLRKAEIGAAESSVRRLTPAEAAALRPAQRPAVALVAMPTRIEAAELAQPPEEPRFSSASWRAEAWEREREREMRAAERRTDVFRRRSR